MALFKNDEVRPFSNGTSRVLWEEGNCHGGCIKAISYEAEVEGKPYRCAIQSALGRAAITGTISTRIAKRAGFDKPHGDGYFPCLEFNDTRIAGTKRTQRRPAGQEAMEL